MVHAATQKRKRLGVVVITSTRINNSVVTGLAPVNMEWKNIPAEK